MSTKETQLREHLRNRILMDANAIGKQGLTLEGYFQGAKAVGLPSDRIEVDREIDYLVGKGLLEGVKKTISPEIPRWKISAAGRDYLAEEGLA